jgi:hypothetical protein
VNRGQLHLILSQICSSNLIQKTYHLTTLTVGSKFHASKLRPEQVSAYRQYERGKVNKHLDDYIRQCSKMKVHTTNHLTSLNHCGTSRINDNESCLNMTRGNRLN